MHFLIVALKLAFFLEKEIGLCRSRYGLWGVKIVTNSKNEEKQVGFCTNNALFVKMDPRPKGAILMSFVLTKFD